MSMGTADLIESGIAAVLFAVIFLFGNHIHPLRRFIRDRRSIISFGAGMSAAYVFVHVMPELHSSREAFVNAASAPLRYEGMAIYFLSLIGFLVFYGMENLYMHARELFEKGKALPVFKLHLSGFAIYVFSIGYLLVHHLGETAVSTTLYAVAIAFHFLSIDHTLRDEHGAMYQRAGRFVLAGMSLLGWATGLVFDLPNYIVALLFAFISGAIIVNSAIMELPSEKDGRFFPFMLGGIVYGVILLPFG